MEGIFRVKVPLYALDYIYPVWCPEGSDLVSSKTKYFTCLLLVHTDAKSWCYLSSVLWFVQAGYTLHDRIIRPAEVGVTVAVENTEANSWSWKGLNETPGYTWELCWCLRWLILIYLSENRFSWCNFVPSLFYCMNEPQLTLLYFGFIKKWNLIDLLWVNHLSMLIYKYLRVT